MQSVAGDYSEIYNVCTGVDTHGTGDFQTSFVMGKVKILVQYYKKKLFKMNSLISNCCLRWNTLCINFRCAGFFNYKIIQYQFNIG